MAEVLVQFEDEIVDGEENAYVARVCGREAEDGLWDGWVEFEPKAGGETLRTPLVPPSLNPERLSEEHVEDRRCS